jgi:DNA polymerase delta subunit 2
MKPRIVEAAKEKLGDNILVKNLVDLKEDDDGAREEDILIVGTVFKQQERKPSILKELSEDGALEMQPVHTVYTAETDSLVLEDESMRVKLEGGEVLKAGDLVNGVVAGIWGREVTGGKFSVKDVIFAKITGVEGAVSEDDISVCVLSGLELGGECSGWVGAAQLATDWVVGSVGGPGEQGDIARVERVIVAGDSLSMSTRDKQDQVKAKYLTANSAAASIAAVRQLDDLLVQLAGNVNTDIMPGPNDPATMVLPQQPLHRVMFPQAGLFPTLQTVTNPYSMEVAGRNFLVVSGQTITDILRNSTLPGPLEAMAKCLEWSHVAPTAPDTLGCYPYIETDPHILTSLPDVFIAGNQPSYGARRVTLSGHSVLLVSVPKFSSSTSLVKISLKSLTCQVVSFGAELDPEWVDR